MDKYTRDIAQGNLFKDELFIVPESANLTLTGSYAFPLLFILNHQNAALINEDNLTFIQSILKQIPNEDPIELDHIGIVNLRGTEISMLQLVRQFKPKYLISWGDIAELKGIEKSKLTPIYLGDIGCIHCPEIEEIKENKEQKILLWQSMKTLFNIT